MKEEAFLESLRSVSSSAVSPAGNNFRCLELGAVIELSRRFALSRKEIELAALQDGIIPLRYQRNIGTVGIDGQIRLLQSRVGVVGAGGLGGLALELLARMGVGSLAAVDEDCFTESNLNRQLLSSEQLLGESKVAAAARRVSELNGAVEFTACHCRGDAGNLAELLGGCHLVLDCLDNLSSRLALEGVCQELNIPLVHGAIAGFLGQVTVVWPGEPVLSNIYGGLKESGQDRGAELTLGNPATTPAMLAAWQVNEAVKIIAGLEGVLRGRLLVIDMISGETAVILTISHT